MCRIARNLDFGLDAKHRQNPSHFYARAELNELTLGQLNKHWEVPTVFVMLNKFDWA